ncbi:nuclear receptor 2C2-associated protein isoform X2 [Gorilla gorilla gorilla]|uniref:nuclear receptor 2C2-associated protein isoform X2 n=1 Tax=Gorilla gorilla gorilla TaxID=9595 RepID=UPI002445CBDE|nr:nuclear receptor 2C2-associated protein [Gorilla gorilla gorilla]
MTHSLVCPETVSRVSSVLNRNTRQFGKKHLFDQDEETCWNSDQGPSQWVTLEFPQLIRVSQLQIQFQGGFSSRRGCLEGSQGTQALRKIVDFYPEDNNSLQAHTFPIPAAEVDRLKVTFEDATDFFGRVVIYHLRVLGEKGTNRDPCRDLHYRAKLGEPRPHPRNLNFP